MPNIYDPAKDPLVTRVKHTPEWRGMAAIHIAAAAYEAERKVLFAHGVSTSPWEQMDEGERIVRMAIVDAILDGAEERVPERETELAARIRGLRAAVVAALMQRRLAAPEVEAPEVDTKPEAVA